MHRVRNSPMKLDPICITKQKFRFENEGERDFEKKRTDEITYTNLCYLLDVTLSIRASLFFSSFCLCCVCNCSLFVFLLPSSSFLLVEGSLFIEKFEKLFPPFLFLNWVVNGQFSWTIIFFTCSCHLPLFSLISLFFWIMAD